MAKIKPITFPLGLGDADELVIRAQLHMEQSFCIVSYELCKTISNKPQPGDPVGIPFNSIVLNVGRLIMKDQDYENWGADNNYVIQWVANQLGVELL